MIKPDDIENMLEFMKENFPKMRDGWDSPNLSVEIMNHENGEYAFYMDSADKFSAECESMKANFDGKNWEAAVVEWIAFSDQTFIMSRLACKPELDAAEQALMDNWLKGMLSAVPEFVKETGIGMPENLAKPCRAYREEGELPADPAEKARLAHEFLELDEKICDAGMSLTDDPEGERQFFHGFSFRQKEPGGKIAVSRVWYAFMNQNGIAEMKDIPIAMIDERGFRKNPIYHSRKGDDAKPSFATR